MNRYFTKKQAAIVLGMAKDRVQRLLDEGVLPAIRDDQDRLWIEAQAVHEIREISNKMERGQRNVSQRVALNQMRIRRLERAVAALNIICQAPATSSLIHLTDQEIERMYHDAVAAGNKTDWPRDEILRWSSIFTQMSEVEIGRVGLVLSVSGPWKPFWWLCTSMITNMQAQMVDPDVKFDDPEVSYALSQGRQNLLSSILIYTRTNDNADVAALEQYYSDSARDRIRKFLFTDG